MCYCGHLFAHISWVGVGFETFSEPLAMLGWCSLGYPDIVLQRSRLVVIHRTVLRAVKMTEHHSQHCQAMSLVLLALLLAFALS